jgi:hypothetical protein
MANEIQSLLNFCDAPNLGGFSKLEYAPVHWVDVDEYDDLVSPAGVWLKAIPFSQGDWLTLPVIFPRRQWEQTQADSDQGNPHNQELRADILNMRASVSVELDKMSTLDYLLKLTTRNQESWIIGTLESPLQFSFRQLTGNSTATKKAYNIRFFGQTAHTAYEYSPVA